MTIASAAVQQLWYVFEEPDGSIPTNPEWLPIRYNDGGNSLTLSAETIESDEIRGDRHKTAARRGTISVGGDIAGQLAYGSYDDFFLAGFAGTEWEAGETITASTVSASSADSSFNDSGTGFAFNAGDLINVSGFADEANNGLFYVDTATAGKITVLSIEGTAVTLVTESSGASVTISAAETLRTGVVRRSMAILQRLTDVGVDYLYTGCEVNTISISGSATEKWVVTPTMIGLKQEQLLSLPAGSTFATVGTSDFMTALDGSLKVDGTEYGFATEYSATIENGIEQKYAIGSDSAVDAVISPITASGTLNAYFDSTNLYNRFLDDIDTGISMIATDGANAYRLTSTKSTFTTGSLATSGTDVITNLGYSAGYDQAELSEFVMERI